MDALLPASPPGCAYAQDLDGPPIERGVTADLLRPYLESYAAALPVRTVAVVGNAPLPPDPERAALIDSADLVLRCNSFVLDRPGEPPVVGTRTNVCVLAHVTNITPDVFRNYRDRAYLVPQVGHSFRLGGPRAPALMMSWPPDLGSMPVPNDMLGLPVIQEMKRDGERRPAVPTTGTLAAAVARRVFPEARLIATGFSFVDNPHQATWSHRYGTVVPVHVAHLLDREGALMSQWVRESGGELRA
ncbi:hypothetical protein [Jatrophihabitans fulvus]